MNVIKTAIDGVVIIKPRLFRDARVIFCNSTMGMIVFSTFIACCFLICSEVMEKENNSVTTQLMLSIKY